MKTLTTLFTFCLQKKINPSGGTVKTVAKTRSVNYEKAIIFLLQKQALLKIQFVCPASDNLELNFVKVPLHSKHHITSS